MKRILLLLTLFGFLLLGGCKSKNATSIAAFTKSVYTPEYAAGFEIAGADDSQSTIIRIFNPWQGANDVEMLYFIARNGFPPEPAGLSVCRPVILLCWRLWDKRNGW